MALVYLRRFDALSGQIQIDLLEKLINQVEGMRTLPLNLTFCLVYVFMSQTNKVFIF